MIDGLARFVGALVGCGLVALDADAACPSTSESLRTWADAGLVAHVSLQWDEVDTIYAAMQEEAGCLESLVPAEDAEQIHRFFALAAGSQKDRPRATAEWQAVQTLNERWELSEAVGRPGSLYRSTFDEARARGAGPHYSVMSTGVWVDGESSTEVPLQRAAFVQVRGRHGLQTWYLVGEGQLPADLRRALWWLEITPEVIQEDTASREEAQPLTALRVEQTVHAPAGGPRAAVPMWVMSGAAGAVAVTGAVIASRATADFGDVLADVGNPEVPQTLVDAQWEMLSLDRRNRNATMLSAASATLSLALCGAGFVVAF